MGRVMILMDLLKERLQWYLEDRVAYEEWMAKNPTAPRWRYEGKIRVTLTEIKRLSLVLRQEMIKWEKSL